jgi:hypothetical protein
MVAGLRVKRGYGVQRKMSQVLSAFGQLDFTTLRPILAWRAFLKIIKQLICLIFQISFSGRGKPGIIETADNETADKCVSLYIVFGIGS